MSSPKETTNNEDSNVDKTHEACGWKKFTNDDTSSDDSDDGGIKVVANKYSDDGSHEKRNTENSESMIDDNKLARQSQGVVVVSLSDSKTDEEVIKTIILNNNNKKKLSDKLQTFNDNNLFLDNKYFETYVQLYNYEIHSKNSSCKPSSSSMNQTHLSDCHAVVIFVDCKKLNFEELNEVKASLGQVQGEPRILACDTFDESDAHSNYKAIIDWCVDNEYEFIPNIFRLQMDGDQEGGHQRLLEALSAYRWPYLKMKQSQIISASSASRQSRNLTDTKINQNGSSEKVLNSDIMKKIEDFDELLTKLNHYRVRPDKSTQNTATTESSHNRNDDELLEIAKKLSSILGDDYGDLLADDESIDDDNSQN